MRRLLPLPLANLNCEPHPVGSADQRVSVGTSAWEAVVWCGGGWRLRSSLVPTILPLSSDNQPCTSLIVLRVPRINGSCSRHDTHMYQILEGLKERYNRCTEHLNHHSYRSPWGLHQSGL